jgi:hypothetical protein
VLLGHVDVAYFRCPRCGLVRTQPPTWLEEAYSSPIASLDVGLLGRCLYLADVTEAVIRSMRPGRRCLDWAGGYGVLTRLMRDRGIDFHHHDPFTTNHFAAGFEGQVEEGWDLITLFEVLEHLEEPVEALSPLVAASPVLLFTTELLPEEAPGPGEWWYYATETGQHITFHTLASLQTLAERLGVRLLTDGRSVHAFHAEGSVSRLTSSLIRSRTLSRRLLPVLRRTRRSVSLLQRDFEAARGRAAKA